MSYLPILAPGPYHLTEVDIDSATGAISTKGPVAVTISNALAGAVIGATYDPAAQTWHVLVLSSG